MNVRIAVFAVVVLCLTARAEQSVSNSLEKATRELQALPEAEKPEALRRSRGIGSASLPSLVVPGASVAPSPPGPNSPPSETWLQDALDATKAGRPDSRRTNTDAARDTLRDGKTSRTPDPFDRYLMQWLSPRDLEILHPETKIETPLLNRSIFDQPAAIQEKVDPLALPGTLPPADPGVGMGPATKNPYLPDPVSIPTGPATYPALPTASAGFEKTPPARGAPLEPSSVPLPGEATGMTPGIRTQTPAAKEAVSPPPTAPVVDDRKYFPQLRRF